MRGWVGDRTEIAQQNGPPTVMWNLLTIQQVDLAVGIEGTTVRGITLKPCVFPPRGTTGTSRSWGAHPNRQVAACYASAV